MACLECRRRRIRCDSGRPKCHHCTRLSKSCQYATCEQRRGPKKRSVKELEDRLATVEAQLQTRDQPSRARTDVQSQNTTPIDHQAEPFVNFSKVSWTVDPDAGFSNIAADFQFVVDGQEWPDTSNAIITTPFHLRMPFEVDKYPELDEVQELNNIFFEEVYPCAPFVHPTKHNPNLLHTFETLPPLCLRYIMWAHAATRSPKYSERATSFYRNARMHLEHDEMQGDGLEFMTVAHVQTWGLVASYEAGSATPARAFMSSRRAIALSNMLGLHQLENRQSSSSDVFERLKPPKDFAEAEERKRTFWYLYFSDRWASAGSGKSSTIRDEEIFTMMPASEDAFQQNFPEQSQTLQGAVSDGLGPTAAPMAAAVLSGWVLSKCTAHLRQAQDMKDDQLKQQFWQRHQQLDNTISQILLTLPDHLRAAHTKNPLAFFVNMCLHQFIISLSQAASTLAQQTPSKHDAVAGLRTRARRSAEEIVQIMRVMACMDVRKMFPFTPSALYMASTVYTTDLNQGHEVEAARQTIFFILFTIKLFRRYCKATQIFIAQLLHDLKECDITLEYSAPDATPLDCWTRVGADFLALGPLFATDTLLGRKQPKRAVTNGVSTFS